MYPKFEICVIGNVSLDNFGEQTVTMKHYVLHEYPNNSLYSLQGFVCFSTRVITRLYVFIPLFSVFRKYFNENDSLQKVE